MILSLVVGNAASILRHECTQQMDVARQTVITTWLAIATWHHDSVPTACSVANDLNSDTEALT